MKKYTFPILTLLVVSNLIAQKSVDIDQLVFEKTENNSLVYSQYAAEAKLMTKTTPSSSIFLDLGAGFADIVQSKDNTLRAKAEIVLSVKNSKRIEKELRDIELYIEERGDQIRLVSKFDYDDDNSEVGGGFFSSPERKINIKVYVPENLQLKIEDRSGDLLIQDLANNLKLRDASGGIKINGLEGNLIISDNSGDIRLNNINKSGGEDKTVKIVDSSGGIYLQDISGDTEIDDTSGEINVLNLRGALAIDDTSGGIDVRNIGGDSKVKDTSGDMSLVSIEGNVTISDTSGGIYVDTVSEDVIVRSDGSGSFTTKNVQGSISKRG
ncbi:MAG: hypothetical protein HRT61_24025 [Ekhidna sp.]|nr:hypothetical protein [Ekhidna sp.]